jgi:hypothetical protein
MMQLALRAIRFLFAIVLLLAACLKAQAMLKS